MRSAFVVVAGAAAVLSFKAGVGAGAGAPRPSGGTRVTPHVVDGAPRARPAPVARRSRRPAPSAGGERA